VKSPCDNLLYHMKFKLTLLSLLLPAGMLFSVTSFAQTLSAGQLEQLEKLSPDQIQKFKDKVNKSGIDGLSTTDRSPSSYSTGERSPATGQGSRQITTNLKGSQTPQLPTDPKSMYVDEMGRLVPREDTTQFNAIKIDEYIKLKKIDTLNVFGREMFWNKNINFAPSLNIPTPSSYILATGDELYIDLWGAAEANYTLTVSPDGHINIPNVGIISLRDLTIDQAERRIKGRIVEAVSGLADGSVNIKVSLGNIRSIRVNIIGEARNPGTYTLPSLATLFNGLYAAGGVSAIGSLRDVKLYRGGKEIASLDVYDYLINRKEEVNVRLEDNDMIVINTYDKLVKIEGRTKRPMRYEMKRGETVADLIRYAGGFTGDAYSNNVTVNRKAGGRQYQIFTVENAEMGTFTVQDGDEVEIGEVIKMYANRVTAEGAVWRQGNFELSDRISTVSDLLKAAEGPRDDAFTGRGQIIRTHADKTREIISINLANLINHGTGDLKLQKDDTLFVASAYYMNEVPTVSIKGEVNKETTVLYGSNMTVQDLIIQARGLKESASLARVEVARRIKNPDATTVAETRSRTFSFPISGDLSLEPGSATFKLEPFDEVYIRRSPGYSAQLEVSLEGEVLFTGNYALTTSADRLTDLVQKAGGFTPEAYVRGAYLYRQITEDDKARFASLRKIIESTGTKADTMGMNQAFSVGSYYSVGINLEEAINSPGSASDIVLNEGDRLIIPTVTNTVKINGAVYYPNTVTYIPGQKLNHYIDQGGGYVKRAYRRPFVIYMNGLVAATKGGKVPRIEPGCEIVVPMKPARVGGGTLPQILSVTTSLASLTALITTMVK